MKLQLLVPQYNETDEIIKPLLDSVAIQQNVDFSDVGVIICNDGSETFLTDALFKAYPYRIDYFKEPHRGVSATRNACLDHATAEYVMFCDADDMFYSVCALYILFREMGGDGFDSLTSLFIEESRHPETHEAVYINHEMDSTFVHGKCHRRQYLIDKGIRWNDALTIHEDSYFNILCQSLSENVKYCPTPFYLWKWRDNSVCRHDAKYMLKTYSNMLDSNEALVGEFLKRDRKDKALLYVGMMIFDAYYTMNKPEWINQENRDYRDSTERRFAAYFKRHRKLWEAIPAGNRMIISSQIRQRSVNEGMQMETKTIDQWLKHISRLKKA